MIGRVWAVLLTIFLTACGLGQPPLVSLPDSVNHPLRVTIYKAPS